MMFERLPPHDVAAEETVIASCLVAEDAMAMCHADANYISPIEIMAV